MKKKMVAAALGVALTVTAVGGVMNQAQALSLGNLLGKTVKVAGIGLLVDKYGSQIDSALNKLLKQNNLSTTYTTAVVPIVSVGNNGYIGAVQVTGPASEVERVKAVAQLETSVAGIARVKGLIPIDSTNPTNASRIQGVGVSAIIDFKI
ncbi:MAG: hypothetical protein HUJ84_05570 [Veillonella sp.]|nr:hypothetical protein [Veillonella sp.]MCF0156561.1 hypothetical protein [Veillonella sp.]